MKLNQTFCRCLSLIAYAAIVLGITGRLAVRQITHDNMDAIKAITGEVYTNSQPDSRPDINKLEVKLYKRVALSSVREKWEDICTVALWLGVLVGAVSVVIYRKSPAPPPGAAGK